MTMTDAPLHLLASRFLAYSCRLFLMSLEVYSLVSLFIYLLEPQYSYNNDE